MKSYIFLKFSENNSKLKIKRLKNSFEKNRIIQIAHRNVQNAKSHSQINHQMHQYRTIVPQILPSFT